MKKCSDRFAFKYLSKWFEWNIVSERMFHFKQGMGKFFKNKSKDNWSNNYKFTRSKSLYKYYFTWKNQFWKEKKREDSFFFCTTEKHIFENVIDKVLYITQIIKRRTRKNKLRSILSKINNSSYKNINNKYKYKRKEFYSL